MVPVCMQNRQFALKTAQASLHESLCNGLGRILFHSHLFSCSIPFFFFLTPGCVGQMMREPIEPSYRKFSPIYSYAAFLCEIVKKNCEKQETRQSTHIALCMCTSLSGLSFFALFLFHCLTNMPKQPL